MGKSASVNNLTHSPSGPKPYNYGTNRFDHLIALTETDDAREALELELAMKRERVAICRSLPFGAAGGTPWMLKHAQTNLSRKPRKSHEEWVEDVIRDMEDLVESYGRIIGQVEIWQALRGEAFPLIPDDCLAMECDCCVSV